MSDRTRNAKRALSVYLERGRQALDLLKNGRFDEANDILRQRNAAFHNFRAVDALALRDGSDIKDDPEAQALWIEIKLIDQKLAESLKAARIMTAALYKKIRETYAKIGAYRSRRSNDPRFEKSA